jgi:hypothetical protein
MKGMDGKLDGENKEFLIIKKDSRGHRENISIELMRIGIAIRVLGKVVNQ